MVSKNYSLHTKPVGETLTAQSHNGNDPASDLIGPCVKTRRLFAPATLSTLKIKQEYITDLDKERERVLHTRNYHKIMQTTRRHVLKTTPQPLEGNEDYFFVSTSSDLFTFRDDQGVNVCTRLAYRDGIRPRISAPLYHRTTPCHNLSRSVLRIIRETPSPVSSR
nr:PREDICTED: uncharacterized protein LOC105677067 [Linepithema humile]